ncbi:hypothetical protein NPX13_g3680 [Xylaria arbuscula]|uniref:Uncharacterized protein n=1 Tax=Xylaria arbuscula TaxID=114810 RepID=A0A9W8NHT5_9PEZI|nr:hypothetical protein NPX13_g3680 [Xylaria arbuscula]
MDHSMNNDMYTQLPDNIWLPVMTDETMYELRPMNTNQGQECCSLPHYMTDGHWFGRASVPDVANVVADNTLDPSIQWSQPCMVSLSSSGSLVCSQPAVSALPQAESCGGLLHAHGAFPFDYSACTSQALGRDCHNTHVSEGLASLQSRSPARVDNTHAHPWTPSSGNGLFEVPSFPTSNSSRPYSLQPPLLPSAHATSGMLPLADTRSQTHLPLDDNSQLQLPESFSFHGSHSHPVLPESGFSPNYASTSYLPIPLEQRGLIESTVVSQNDHSPEHPQSVPGGSDPSSIKLTDGVPQQPAKQKASKVFICPSYPTCDYKAVSMKDVFRHARSKKHRYVLEDTPFRCEEQGCKSATSGFPRRDNWLRHMSTVHGIQAPRQKPGRKRLNRRVDEAVE